MIERTLAAALVIGGIGFAAFQWVITRGWEEIEARNVLLLMMVLFESFHIGNGRSETRSAFSLSPIHSPILLSGAVGALLIHLTSMCVPFMQSVLETAPMTLVTWVVVAALAVAIVPTVELHNPSWSIRSRKQAGSGKSHLLVTRESAHETR